MNRNQAMVPPNREPQSFPSIPEKPYFVRNFKMCNKYFSHHLTLSEIFAFFNVRECVTEGFPVEGGQTIKLFKA